MITHGFFQLDPADRITGKIRRDARGQVHGSLHIAGEWWINFETITQVEEVWQAARMIMAAHRGQLVADDFVAFWFQVEWAGIIRDAQVDARRESGEDIDETNP